ncbi:hypothetical protein, partial [Phaeodactylibacter xiamenensis]|uniref:hypothetical protein n=1 Tax=Phaeodactylibacter xiamenensis TaxID=1524460 RepID=UPI0024A9B65E
RKEVNVCSDNLGCRCFQKGITKIGINRKRHSAGGVNYKLINEIRDKQPNAPFDCPRFSLS